jgi:mannose-6-phosphate isomerase-like protein (cupin superfamily)
MAAAPVVVPCADLDEALAHYVDRLAYRLDMITPADAPREALVSRDGVTVRLVAAKPTLAGRAGMHYRDLIPSRLGGRFIASHIRIPEGGPVADYVHYHHIRFQMIYCRRGWVRVVYEDQGPPFVMREGDCVLQPPGIRHRVLESSPGLEVIEIASPAEHETWRDHDLDLPTPALRPERLFDGQRFVRHVAADARWRQSHGVDIRDTGIGAATNGLASVRVLRLAPGKAGPTRRHAGEFLFFAVLGGRLRVGDKPLAADDCCVIPIGAEYALEALEPCEVLEVALPAVSAA